MEEVAVLLQQYLIQQCNTGNVDDQPEDALPEHLCLRAATWAINWELFLRENPHEYFAGSILYRALHDHARDDRWEEDGECVRIALSALRELAVELPLVVDHLNDIEDCPASAQHDAWVEE